jgi:coenzyme Q-binding protein COQ10
MPKYQDSRALPYLPQDLFTLVCDVEKYPEFLPSIQAITLQDKRERYLKASVFYGYQFLKGSYVCEIHLTPYQQVDIVALEGPFKHLTHQWRFDSETSTTTRVSFMMNLEWGGLVGAMLQPLASKGVSLLIEAFENRAHHLYGKKRYKT